MTPVETLREASRLMRKRAEAALPGPWRTDGARVWAVDRHLSVVVKSFVDEDDQDFPHIASWHPAVALAVADLLDNMAQGVERSWATTHESELLEPYVRSIVLARSYLGIDE